METAVKDSQKIEPICLTTVQAGRWLGLNPRMLRHWRLRGVGPRVTQLFDGPKNARYTISDLQEFVRQVTEAGGFDSRK